MILIVKGLVDNRHIEMGYSLTEYPIGAINYFIKEPFSNGLLYK